MANHTNNRCRQLRLESQAKLTLARRAKVEAPSAPPANLSTTNPPWRTVNAARQHSRITLIICATHGRKKALQRGKSPPRDLGVADPGATLFFSPRRSFARFLARESEKAGTTVLKKIGATLQEAESALLMATAAHSVGLCSGSPPWGRGPKHALTGGMENGDHEDSTATGSPGSQDGRASPWPHTRRGPRYQLRTRTGGA